MKSYSFIIMFFILSCSFGVKTPDDKKSEPGKMIITERVDSSICNLTKDNIDAFDHKSITYESILADKECLISSMDSILYSIVSIKDSSGLLLLDKISCYVFDWQWEASSSNMAYLFYNKFDLLIWYLSTHPNSCMQNILIHGFKTDILAAEISEQEVLTQLDKYVKKCFSKKKYSALEKKCWAAIRKEIYFDDRIETPTREDVEKRLGITKQ